MFDDIFFLFFCNSCSPYRVFLVILRDNLKVVENRLYDE